MRNQFEEIKVIEDANGLLASGEVRLSPVHSFNEPMRIDDVEVLEEVVKEIRAMSERGTPVLSRKGITN
ncbi:MAG: hypothetical protein H7301_05055 [Cryobacterium sp.]|nr:hypothetical protein [Oligoflexia bacterium]